MARRSKIVAVFAATMIGVAARASLAQPVAAPPTQSDIKVNLRVDPDLERQWPDVRSAIAASGTALVAEQADYIVATDRYLPDYVQLQRAIGVSSETSMPTISIGRISTGDARQVLTRLLPYIQRQKALDAISQRQPPTGVTFCKLDLYPPHACMDRERAQSVGPIAESQISNGSDTARYVAFFSSTPDLDIRANLLDGERKVVRLEPGRSIRIPNAGISNIYLSQEIVIVSDRPFDAAAFEQTGPYKTMTGCYTRIYPDCLAVLPPLPPIAGLSAISMTFVNSEPEPAMGGGFNASRGDADWMVELYSTLPYSAAEIEADRHLPPEKRQYLAERTPEERSHACGGTMIAPDLVLTAAHCVATGRFLGDNIPRVFKDRRVRVGSLRMGKGGETRAIVGVAVHAGYTGVGSGLPNDIALLLVKSDDRFRLDPPALDIATKPAEVGSTVTGLGWGYTQSVAPGANLIHSASDELQRNPGILQQASLEVLATAKCKQRLPNRIKPGMICLVTPRSVAAAGGPSTFSCRGDSGGPLVRDYGRGADELVGLTSWSLGCGYKDTPSVYTDVAYFARWIAAARRAIKAGQAVRVPEPARAR